VSIDIHVYTPEVTWINIQLLRAKGQAQDHHTGVFDQRRVHIESYKFGDVSCLVLEAQEME
jgi:hypothetical protein